MGPIDDQATWDGDGRGLTSEVAEHHQPPSPHVTGCGPRVAAQYSLEDRGNLAEAFAYKIGSFLLPLYLLNISSALLSSVGAFLREKPSAAGRARYMYFGCHGG